jgi:hypothetical protein
MADISEQEAAELLLLLRINPIPETPPAEIMDHVPRTGNSESSHDRSLLLTSLAAITAIMGAGIIFMKQIFKDSNFDFNTVLRRPSWGKYMIELTPEQQRKWCTNTAYYIDAMRTNKQLLITGTGNDKKIRPVPSDSTGLAITPESSMRLNGNEIIEQNDDKTMVYKHNDEVIALPEDPVELSAFCMAHFIHKENIQTLINWGEDFRLISEEDLLRILGELGEEDDWKRKIVNNILKNAYDVYKQTQEFNNYVNGTISSSRDQLSELNTQINNIISEYPKYKDKCLLKIARDHPELWVASNYAVNYPIQSSLIILFLTFYMRKEIKKISELCKKVGNTSIRFLKWLTGQNPDDEPSNELVLRGGEKRKRENKLKKTVMLISKPLSDDYINKLFDEKSIDSFVEYNSFVEYINKNIKKKGYTDVIRRKVKAFKKSKKEPISVIEVDMLGGKRKTFRLLKNKITKKKKQNHRNTQKR